MSPHKHHLQPGGQIVEETEPGAAYGKYVLEEALFPVAGPQVQIVHVQALDFNPPVQPKGSPQKDSHEDYVVLPLTVFSRPGHAKAA